VSFWNRKTLDNWVMTDFGRSNAIELRLLDDSGTVKQVFDLVKFDAKFMVNGIPYAECAVAAGMDIRRSAPGDLVFAPIHDPNLNLQKMQRAEVWINPGGWWDSSRREVWGTTPRCLFQGYYTGQVRTTSSDKIQAVLHLTHWLVDLQASSILSSLTHPSNPTSLIDWAVVSSSTDRTGASGSNSSKEPVLNPASWHNANVKRLMASDLWNPIHKMFCALANVDRTHISCKRGGCSTGPVRARSPNGNERAKRALEKFECAPDRTCRSLPQSGGYSLPLKVPYFTGIQALRDSVAKAVTRVQCNTGADTSYWGKLLEYSGMFSFLIVPLIDRALIVADTPAFATPWRKTIEPWEYGHINFSANMTQPLAGVGVSSPSRMITGVDVGKNSKDGPMCLGGQYTTGEEGAWLVVPPPAWLSGAVLSSVSPRKSTNIGQNGALPTGTSPVETTPQDMGDVQQVYGSLCDVYQKQAKDIYLRYMLQGRNANVMGKFRLDISPGSIVSIGSKGLNDSKWDDAAAERFYGFVSEVGISLSAEEKTASTSFGITHVRTHRENTNSDPRQKLSTDEHPLYGSNVFTGASMNATYSPGTVDRTWEF